MTHCTTLAFTEPLYPTNSPEAQRERASDKRMNLFAVIVATKNTLRQQERDSECVCACVCLCYACVSVRVLGEIVGMYYGTHAAASDRIQRRSIDAERRTIAVSGSQQRTQALL